MPAVRKHSARYASLAHYFGALMRDLRDSYPQRVGEALRIADLATRTGYSPSMISAIERGEHLPDGGDRVRALDEALDAKGQLVTLWPLVQRLGRHRVDDLIAAIESGNTAVYAPHPRDDDMERRELFRLAGLGILTGSPAFTTAEPVRQLIEQTLGAAETNSVEDWEAACKDHHHAVITRPADEVRDSLVLDLAVLQRSLAAADAAHKADLQRLVAWLSALHANTLTRLGEFGGARRWWATARHAADASGQQEMRVWVRAKESLFGLYTPRAPETLLPLARDAQQIARQTMSAGSLTAVCAEAQTLAVLGQGQEARRRLKALQDLAGRFDGNGDPRWTEDSAWFAASWVFSHLGASESAAEAREEALKRSSSYQNMANLRLHEAVSVAREGGHGEGLLLATQVISGLDPAYRTHMIMHTARKVKDVIPLASRTGTAFADYHAALTASLV